MESEFQSSPSSSSMDTTMSTINSSALVTTLELHPNVILGIPDDDDLLTPGERPHLCNVCNASYKTKTHLRRHMFIHMSSRPFPCSECGKGFNRKEHLNKHLEAVHSGTKHNCPYCQKEISRLDHLKRHIKNMHTNAPKEKSDKQAVMKIQMPYGSKKKAQLNFLTPTFPPGTIGQTIITPIPVSATSMQLQTKVKHEPNIGIMTSTAIENSDPLSMTIIPSNILPGQGVATLAVQSTHSQKVLVHQRLPSGSNVDLDTATNGLVGLANLSLSLGSNITASSDESEIDDKKMLLQIFNCGECTATFTTEKDLISHGKIHKPQPYQCSDCPRAYTRREKLTEHIRSVHQGQKFTCEYCGKELSRKDHVLRHIRSVHPEVYAGTIAEMAESDFLSENQGLSYGRKKKNSHHIKIPSIGDVGVLLRSVCHICLKVFGTAYHLTRHVESCHNGDVRPFSCSACNKMFKRKDHLTKHRKSHCASLKPGGISIKSLQLHQPDETLSENLATTSRQIPKIFSEDVSKIEDSSLLSGHRSPSPNTGDLFRDSHVHKVSEQYSLAVIDSLIQGNVNVVVVDDDMSNYLQQTTTSQMTTTFPCGQCQKEFSGRDQLISHLQEHSSDHVIIDDRHISDINFSDF